MCLIVQKSIQRPWYPAHVQGLQLVSWITHKCWKVDPTTWHASYLTLGNTQHLVCHLLMVYCVQCTMRCVVYQSKSQGVFVYILHFSALHCYPLHHSAKCNTAYLLHCNPIHPRQVPPWKSFLPPVKLYQLNMTYAFFKKKLSFAHPLFANSLTLSAEDDLWLFQDKIIIFTPLFANC